MRSDWCSGHGVPSRVPGRAVLRNCPGLWCGWTEETQNEVKRIITDSLEWIVEDGLAKDIEVDTEIENKSRLNYSVLVRKPDNNTEIIKGVWNNE